MLFFNFSQSLLTYLDVTDIVNVWNNVSKLIERQMALQKVSKYSRVLKFNFMHVQWNVSCTANFARLLQSRESFIIATANRFTSNTYQRSVDRFAVTLFKVKVSGSSLFITKAVTQSINT